MVACPDYNDGAELEETLRDLTALHPGVLSVAVVPVGLTGYREGLAPLRMFKPEEARKVLSLIAGLQQQWRQQQGISLVYAADEFYLLAGETVPASDNYDGFPQLENGVGLVRLFLDSWAEVKGALPSRLSQNRQLLLITGKSAQPILEPIADELNGVDKLQVQVVPVPNRFFGESVTVAGLVTGRDIISTVKAKARDLNLPAAAVCIPSVMLKKGEKVFLDGVTLKQLTEELKLPVKVVDLENQAADLVGIIREMA